MNVKRNLKAKTSFYLFTGVALALIVIGLGIGTGLIPYSPPGKVEMLCFLAIAFVLILWNDNYQCQLDIDELKEAKDNGG